MGFDVAYRLVLPPQLSGFHDIFHISMLQKYELDLSHVLEWSELELDVDLTFEEKLIQILD